MTVQRIFILFLLIIFSTTALEAQTPKRPNKAKTGATTKRNPKKAKPKANNTKAEEEEYVRMRLTDQDIGTLTVQGIDEEAPPPPDVEEAPPPPDVEEAPPPQIEIATKANYQESQYYPPARVVEEDYPTNSINAHLKQNEKMRKMSISGYAASESDEIYTLVDQQAYYDNENDWFADYEAEQIRRPLNSKKEDIGKVVVKCIIEKDGTISSGTIARGLTPELNDAAIAYLLQLPKMIPALHQRKLVRSAKLLSVKFTENTPYAAASEKAPKAQNEVMEAPSEAPMEVMAEERISNTVSSETNIESSLSVEKQAVYPGGEAAQFKYISSNLKYPLIAIENGVQGNVIIEFIVETDGSISNIKVVRDIHGGCGQEAVRLIKGMSKWTPAMKNGKAVRQKVVLPIRFKLEG